MSRNMEVYSQLVLQSKDTKDGSQQILLPLASRPPCDCAKKVKTQRQKMVTMGLSVLLLLLTLALCGLVIALYKKTVNLEEHEMELLGVAVAKPKRTPNKVTPEQALIDERMRPKQEVPGVKPEMEDESERNDGGINKKISIHLIGNSSHLSMTTGDLKAEFQPITNWMIRDEWSTDQEMIYSLVNHSSIEIQEDGLYMIYGQLSWRMKSDTAQYRIQSLPKGSGSPETLTQCVSHFSERYNTPESCYTSVTVPLTSGDQLVLSVLPKNLTIDFHDGKSFLGVSQFQRGENNYD